MAAWSGRWKHQNKSQLSTTEVPSTLLRIIRRQYSGVILSQTIRPLEDPFLSVIQPVIGSNFLNHSLRALVNQFVVSGSLGSFSHSQNMPNWASSWLRFAKKCNPCGAFINQFAVNGARSRGSFRQLSIAPAFVNRFGVSGGPRSHRSFCRHRF